MPIAQFNHAAYRYPDSGAPALDDVSFSLEPGTLTLVAGASGSGKTTLLRLLAGQIKPTAGEVHTAGQARLIPQRPEALFSPRQTPRQYLESLLDCLPPDTARQRLGETAGYFAMEPWLDKPTGQLSGGQRQHLAIAAALTQGGDLLVLDEPTAQLDPIAAGNLTALLRRLCRELCLTIVLSEHRTESLFALADQTVFLEQGRCIAQGSGQAVAETICRRYSALAPALPTPARVHLALGQEGVCPITVTQGREMLARLSLTPQAEPAEPAARPCRRPVLSLSRVWFRYAKEGPDVLRELSLSLAPGEILAVAGGNGAGKSTMLQVLSGKLRPYRGTVSGGERTLLLPQDPLPFLGGGPISSRLSGRLAAEFGLTELLNRQPSALSCGEAQLAAAALALQQQPEVLLLDEPTRGVDPIRRDRLAQALGEYAQAGHSVLLVSHDVEFCAMVAHRCGLFFDGQLIATGTPEFFFGGNFAYTTAANRMGRQWFPQAVTCPALIACCQRG